MADKDISLEDLKANATKSDENVAESEEVIEESKEKSLYETNIEIAANDDILILQTCSYNNNYRNNKNMSDTNTIMYGHDMRNGSMFGSLRNALKWSGGEHYIEVIIDNKLYKYLIFSVYTIDNTDDYLGIVLNDSEYADFINLIKNRSIINYGIDVINEDKIITLSSCYGTSSKKLVVHGKLILN